MQRNIEKIEQTQSKYIFIFSPRSVVANFPHIEFNFPQYKILIKQNQRKNFPDINRKEAKEKI